MEFVSQPDQCQMDAPLRFEIPVIETLQEHESNEEGEDEIKDRRGVMLETVIERPISHQGVEQIVFDLPASMSDVPEQPRGHLGHRERRHPPPVVDLRLFDPLVVLVVPFRYRFLRMENAQGNLNPFRRAKAFRIPSSDLRSPFFPNFRFHQREDALGILKEHPMFPLEHTDHVFVMLQTEIVKGGFRIEGIGQGHIKESSIAKEHSFQQSLGRNHLSLSGLNHLHIQRHRYRESHQMKNHASMIILDHLFVIDLHRPLTTLGTASISTGKKTHGHRRPPPGEANRFEGLCYGPVDG